MAAKDLIAIRNLSRRTLRFGSPQAGSLVQLPAASPTGAGTVVYIDAADPTVKRDLYRNLGSYVIEGGIGVGVLSIAKQALTATAATTAGAVGAWQNPTGAPIVVSKIILDVTTQSTGAANVTTASATTATGSAVVTLGAAQAVGAVGVFAPAATPGKLGATDFVNFTGSATTVGLVANAYIHYSLV